MITDKQIVDTLGIYNSLGVLKEEIRSYEVSLWTLQDEFITVLKWSDVEQKGRIESPKMKLNIDGTQELTFNIPMYYRINGKLEINPNWYNVENGSLIASTRKIKVIFNKHTEDEAVFEFLIIDVNEAHEEDDLTCELKCEGLAFHELGKVGYRFHLSQEVFEEEYYTWAQEHIGAEPMETIDYWCKKINLIPYPNDIDLVNSTQWYYRVQMSWRSFRTGKERISDKIYEDDYTASYDIELRPTSTNTTLREKARAIQAEGSNLYNITQSLAETFGVFCRYDYLYDENYHIIGRIVTFYNSFLKEDDDLFTLTYPYSSNKISREMDATNLTTKLYVLDVDDNTSYTGYRSIMDAEANKTRENYILNFDYMKAIGNINEEQEKAIHTFEEKIKILNDKLIQLSNNVAAYNELIPKLEAQAAVHKKAQDTALEQIDQNSALRNALDLEDGNADGYITLQTPDQKIIISDKDGGNFINFTDDKKGIVQGTLHIYRSYNSANNTLSDEILDFTVEVNEYNNITRVKGLPEPGNSAIVYLIYTYNPVLYYDSIINTWKNRLGKDREEYQVVMDRLGEEDYVPAVDDIDVASVYSTLRTTLSTAIEGGTVEADYYKRPHLLDDDNNMITYMSISASNSAGNRHVLVTPILPSGERMPNRIALGFANGYAENEFARTAQLEYNKTVFSFEDIYMGTFATADRANAAGQAYSAYHAAVMNATTGGLRKRDKDAKVWIEALMKKKDELIHDFESMMGPALREGYWQPDDYRDYGEQKSFSGSFIYNTTESIMDQDTGTEMELGWESPPNLFDGEDDIHYKIGMDEVVNTYPCVNLQSVWNQINTHLDDFSFIYNCNYLEDEFDENNIKNLTIYKFGSKALIRFIRQGSIIYPALVLVGTKTLPGTPDDPTTPLGFFYSEKANPRIAIINTTVNKDTGVATTTITNSISVKAEEFWSFNGEKEDKCEVVYPRIKCSSLNLKTDTTNLIIHYNNILLNQFEHYYINTKNVERNGNYYAEYFITLKPEVIYKNGLSSDVEVNYVLSNANTSIYLDAKEVAKENAFPKVSYEVSPSVLTHDLSRILYKKLAQILMINDTDLKLQNTFGYISEVDLDLDDVTADTITIKNYKTKFEDLFSNIIAQTEAMKRATSDLSAIGSGTFALSGEGLSQTLTANQQIMAAYLDSYFDSSAVIYDRLTDIFYEAGQILGGANETLNKMQSLSTQNASILAGFAENVAKSLTIKVYKQQNKPTNFKTGDVWIQTDSNGNEVGRYVATSNGTAKDNSTKGFVRTWDGTLAQINGESLNIDAVAGTIDIEARNQINIKSGHNVYIAAGEDVDIVGNRSVNIGGTEINIASLHVQDADGNILDETVPVTGINLIAGGLDQKGTGTVSEVLIKPTKIEFASSDILMKSASSIELISSTGEAKGTSAISISADNGVWIGAGAGLRLYSGTAADHIWVGPKHKPKFQAGDIWIQVNRIGENGHNSYDGDPSLESNLANYYKNFLEKGQGQGAYVHTYIANTNWEEAYNNNEAAAIAAAGTADPKIWTQNDEIIDIRDVNNAMGASVELTDEHLLFGFSNVAHGTANSTAIEMTDQYMVFAAGQGFDDLATREVTGLGTGLTGAKITRNSIGLAISDNGAITAMLMDQNGFTVGSGFTNTNLATSSKEDLRAAVDGGDKGSYVRINPEGIELGSLADLYINTDNFKLQTHSRDKGGNTLYKDGDTLLAVGKGLQQVGYETTMDELQALNDNELAEVRLVLNKNGLYLKGNVYADNGVFNGIVYASGGSFTGDIYANSIYLNDSSSTEGQHDLQTYLEALQAQVDGEISTWHGTDDPLPNNKDQAYVNAARNFPAVDWITSTLDEKHYGDVYYNDESGQAFRWIKDSANKYIWGSISDTEITDVNNRVTGVADGSTGLAFTGTGTNTFVALNKQSGLVIMGKQQTTGDYTGYYPYFRASNNAMGFFYSTTPSSAAAPSNNDKAMLYFDNGDLYIAGTLYASEIFIKSDRTSSDKVGWNTYWTNKHDTWRSEVTEQITSLFNEAGTILSLAGATLEDQHTLTTENANILAGYLASAETLNPKKNTGANPPTTFKPGDLWWPSSGTYKGNRYIAISFSDAADDTSESGTVNPLKGWNRTQDGTLASITGAGLNIDAAAGTLDLYAESKITLKAKSQLDLASGDIQITGNNSINIGSKWINIASTSGINVVNTAITNATSSSGAKLSGTVITIDSNGIDLTSNGKIKVHSSSAIEVMATANNVEGSVVTINNSGINLLSTGTINLSSNAQDDGTGGIKGSNFKMTPSRLMFGVTTGTSGTSISMDASQIIIAAGGVAQANSGTEITTVTTGTVGMQLRQNYIGMAAGGASARTLLALRPTKLLFGIGLNTETDYGTGSYILMEKVTGSDNKEHASMTIASTGYFKVLSPHLLIDNTSSTIMQDARGAGTQLNNVAFYLGSTDEWEDNTKGILFYNNKLRINADEIHISSNNLYFGTDTAKATLDAMVVSTIKLYQKSNESSMSTAPTSDTGWHETIQTANATTGRYIYSTIKSTTKGGTVTYSLPQRETELETLSKTTYKMYRRTAANPTNDPTITDSNRTTKWYLAIPAPTTSTSSGSDSSTGYGTYDKTTTTVTNPWVWSVDVTMHMNGTYEYGTPEHEFEYDDKDAKIAQVTDMINGKIPIPYVKSSGLTVDGNYVSLQSTGTLTLFSGAQLLIGTKDTSTGKQSTIALNKDGIYINTTSGGNVINLTESGVKIVSADAGIEIGTGSGNNIILDNDGIRMETGKLFSVWNNSFGIYTDGWARGDGHSYVMWAGARDPGDTLTGDTWSGYNVVSQRGAPFRVTADGRVFMDYLMLWDSSHNVYKEIDFSDFNQAVSLSLVVDGNDVRARANFWGKFNTTVAKGVTLKLNSVTRNGGNVAYGVVDIDVDVTALVGGTAAKTDILHGTNVDCKDLVDSGWRQAVGLISYTEGAKTVTVPTGSTGAALQWVTTQLDISATYKAGYQAASDTVSVAMGSVTVPSGNNSTLSLSVVMTKGTPSASGGKAAVQIGGVKAGDIDITDWWTEGYNAGWGAAAALVPSSISGSDQSVRVPSSTVGSGTQLSLQEVYNAGWNAAIAAAKAVTDAYHAGTSTTWTDSGTKKCAEGHSVSWSTSHTYTPQGTAYSGLYTLPATK